MKHLRLVFVDGDVVGDLDAPDLAALIALADRELHGDRRVCGDGVIDDLLVLGIGVEVLEACRLDRCGRGNTHRNDERKGAGDNPERRQANDS